MTRGAAELPGGIGTSRPFDPAWCLEAAGGTDPAAVESQLCLSDGVVGSRAVLEEGDPIVAPVLVAGVYEPADTVGERLMTTAPWTGLHLVEGIPAGRRVLDLRDGLLTREAGDSRGTLRSARFACHYDPGVEVQVVEEAFEAGGAAGVG